MVTIKPPSNRKTCKRTWSALAIRSGVYPIISNLFGKLCFTIGSSTSFSKPLNRSLTCYGNKAGYGEHNQYLNMTNNKNIGSLAKQPINADSSTENHSDN